MAKAAKINDVNTLAPTLLEVNILVVPNILCYRVKSQGLRWIS